LHQLVGSNRAVDQILGLDPALHAVRHANPAVAAVRVFFQALQRCAAADTFLQYTVLGALASAQGDVDGIANIDRCSQACLTEAGQD
jgi:hypothetical protein